MAASFKAMSRRLGRTLKQVATQRSWGFFGALVGATVGSVLLKRTRSPDAPATQPAAPSHELQTRQPEALPELVPAPERELTPPHGDPLTRGVTQTPRPKRRSRAQRASGTQREIQHAAQAETPSDAEVALSASAASASEREPTLVVPPPAKGAKRTRATHSPRRGRTHPAK